jgi:hypothetical protein
MNLQTAVKISGKKRNVCNILFENLKKKYFFGRPRYRWGAAVAQAV